MQPSSLPLHCALFLSFFLSSFFLLSFFFLSFFGLRNIRGGLRLTLIVQSTKGGELLAQDKFKLQTFVVSAGVTFGAGEQLLHYLFKAAWENAPALPLYSGGQNVLPMIHVKDLAQVVQNIADSPPRTRYIVAACDAKNTLEEVTKAVAQHLGNGKVKSVAKEEALIQKDVRQADVETLTTSLRMEAAFIRENMRINWVAESGAIEQMPALVKDFRATRKLFPLRIAVLGPPAVGKSTVAKQLAEHYKLHHIRIKDLIEESIKDLERWAARSANGGAAAAGASLSFAHVARTCSYDAILNR